VPIPNVGKIAVPGRNPVRLTSVFFISKFKLRLVGALGPSLAAASLLVSRGAVVEFCTFKNYFNFIIKFCSSQVTAQVFNIIKMHHVIAKGTLSKL
jgi:hypothetical protein